MEHAATVRIGQRPHFETIKGQIVKDISEPTIVQAPERISLFVLPVPKADNRLRVSLLPVSQWEGPSIQKRANQLLNIVLPRMTEIQILLSSKQYFRALQKIEALEKEYPSLTYLKFIKSSCLLLLDKRVDARIEIEKGLADFPDNEEAKKLVEWLAGQKAP